MKNSAVTYPKPYRNYEALTQLFLTESASYANFVYL